MGLSASMWTSVSGLLAHGNKMNVVGNNIANVSTIGFKGQRMDFNDYLYVNGGSTSGTVQIGAGVSTYAVLGDFSQGSLESTNSVTDLAIDGNGWFKVRRPNTEQMYYTRAGDFYFNAERQLQNPEGYRLQGWKVDNNRDSLTFFRDSVNLGKNTKNESAYVGSGTPKDIVLDSWYLEPNRTNNVSFTMGLTSDKLNDRATAAAGNNPATSLYDQWNANNLPEKSPMPDSFAASSDIKIYDEGGNAHTLTVYYDQVANKTDNYAMQNFPAGYTMYEYVVTIPPEEDMRSYGGEYDSTTGAWIKDPTYFNETDPKTGKLLNKNAGLLMTGHLIFDSAGNLVQQTAYTLGGGTDVKAGEQWDGGTGINNMAEWRPTKFSSNGLPLMNVNFTGKPGASNVWEDNALDTVVEMDFGLRNLSGQTNAKGSLADLMTEDADGNKNPDYKLFATFESTQRMENATSAGLSTFVTQDASQNGFASGVLSGTNITTDGVVYGYYDNGETIPLYQIALYDFHNEQGLRREGGNLYAQTKESGEARQGVPGDNGFGVTRAYNIEGSNVDMSREFVNMITTQRGFQANSKGVTTVDTMLETVIGMKR